MLKTADGVGEYVGICGELEMGIAAGDVSGHGQCFAGVEWAHAGTKPWSQLGGSSTGIIHLILSSVAHDNNLVAERFFTLVDEQGKFVADPVHLQGQH